MAELDNIPKNAKHYRTNIVYKDAFVLSKVLPNIMTIDTSVARQQVLHNLVKNCNIVLVKTLKQASTTAWRLHSVKWRRDYT